MTTKRIVINGISIQATKVADTTGINGYSVSTSLVYNDMEEFIDCDSFMLFSLAWLRFLKCIGRKTTEGYERQIETFWQSL